jgi:hypothetical protein
MVQYAVPLINNGVYETHTAVMLIGITADMRSTGCVMIILNIY